MEELAHHIDAKSNRYTNVLEWIKLLSVTGFAQILVQGLSAVSGILIIRLLPTEEYAYYTLINIMVGTMTILADGGISTGIMGEGGKVWNDREKLGSVLVSGLDLRKKFALGSMIIASPVLFLLLRHHGASLMMSFLLLISLIPVFLTNLSGALLEIGPKLKQDIFSLQKVQVGLNVGRLMMVTIFLFVFPWAFVAVLSSGFPQLWANYRLRKISSNYTDWKQQPNPLIQKDVLLIVKRILPTAIYFCVSGQITIWLLSFFGSTISVAQVGALGRLAVILSIFNVLFSTLAVPRFARLHTSRELLIAKYSQIQAGVIGLSICIVGVTWMYHSQVLWLLGNAYQHLGTELLLNIIGCCLTLIAGLSFSLYTSRGWVIKPVVSIPINIVAVTLGIVFLDIATLKGILMLNIVVASCQIVMNNIFVLLKLMSINKQKENVDGIPYNF
jgi:O-antigen/teichoic acid export membrane protein